MLKSLFLNLASNVYIKLTGLFLLPLFAREMTLNDFGAFALSQTLLGYAIALFSNGIKKKSIIELSSSEFNSKKAWDFYTVRKYLLVIGFLLTIPINLIIFNSIYHKVMSIVISSTLLSLVLNITWIKDAQSDMSFSAKHIFLERNIFIFIIILGVLTSEIIVYCLAFPVSSIISALIIRRGIERPTSYTKKFDFNKFKIIKASLLIGLASTVSTLNLTLDQIMIASFTDERTLGIYSAVSRLYIVICSFGWVVSYTLTPKISSNRDNYRSSMEMLNKIASLALVFTIPICAITFYFSDDLINIILSNKYAAGKTALQILSPMIIVGVLSSIFSDSLDIYGLEKIRLKIILICVLINLILNYLLINYFGLNGAAFSTLISQIILLIISIIYLKSKS